MCDGRDQDCDSSLDENPNVSWYRDQDLDGWTAPGGSTLACTDPDGATGGWLASATTPTDCNDGNAALNHDDDDNDLWDKLGRRSRELAEREFELTLCGSKFEQILLDVAR